MLRRTRRNLSDPRIRHIIKKQQKFYQGNPFLSSEAGNSRRLAGRIILIMLLVAIFVISGTLLKSGRFAKINFTSREKAVQPETHSPDILPHAPVTTPSRIEDKPGTKGPIESVAEQKIKQTPQPAQRKIQIEILNGAGAPGIASRLTRYFRKNDIDVVFSGNYKNFGVKKTKILNRSGNSRHARKIASLLGLDSRRVSLKKNTSLQLDVTLIIGADYKKLKAFK